MKVLLYSDGQGWIVDRISKKMQELCSKYEVDITLNYYTGTPMIYDWDEFDVIHFNNWDIEKWKDRISSSKTPVIVSVRSHRYPSWVPLFLNHNRITTHVINTYLVKDFYNSVYIPDGIFTDNLPIKENFTVGMVFQNNSEYNRKYKGYPIVKEACNKLCVNLIVAGGGISAENMRGFYDACDLIVVASEDEGHNTIALECAAMNKPVLTTDVGLAKELNLHKFERNVPSLVHEIQKFYTAPQVIQYNWESVCENFSNLYRKIINGE